MPTLKRRTRSGSRKIDHRQEGTRKDSEWSGKTRFGGFFVACEKARTGLPARLKPNRHYSLGRLLHNGHDLLDEPLQSRIPLPLSDTDDVQLEGAEIEGQIEQLQG